MDHFDISQVQEIIEQNHLAYDENFAKGDATEFAKHYTRDACIFPTHYPKMCGTDAINAFFKGAFQLGIRNIKLTCHEVMGGPEIVTETGKVELFMEDNICVFKGKFVLIWKQENAQWKMHRDIWNIDTPAETKH